MKNEIIIALIITLVLGVPGFVPLKNGKAGSPATITEGSGAS